MGDGHPMLEANHTLRDLVMNAREISAAQMYGAFDPKFHQEHFASVVRLSGAHLERIAQLERLQAPEETGPYGPWGGPVSDAEVLSWEGKRSD